MKSDLNIAHSLLQRRKFSKVISLLESEENVRIHKENFDYSMTLGLACLYIGDTGSAGVYFQQARRIRLTDPTLLTAQAVLFLRRLDTDRAVQYYLDVLDVDPKNKTALAALEFIKKHGTEEEINRIVDTDEISRFYPPLGPNPDIFKRIFLSVFAGVILALLIMNGDKFRQISGAVQIQKKQPRADLSELFLSVDEMEKSKKTDLSGGVYRYILSDKEITKSYNDALNYFQEYKENLALVEVNRLLNSNAEDSIKEKSKVLVSYFKEPTFDSLSDNFEYYEVAKEPLLYIGCWVQWAGRISNSRTEDDSLKCDLLVGYENMERVDGIVPVVFSPVPQPPIDGEKSVRILGKLAVENGKLVLNGKSVYQPLR